MFHFASAVEIFPKGFTSWLPAQSWEDALLTGNGTLGAMVLGDPFAEQITVNHALLYIPNEAVVIPPNMAPYFDHIKQLSFEGKYKEVAELGYKLWTDENGPKRWTDPFVPAFDINLSMPAENVEYYRRLVNYETAEAVVEWSTKSGTFTRKTFVSRADDVLVTQISGTAPISVKISMGKHPHSWEQSVQMQELIKKHSTTVDEHFMHFHLEYGKPHQYSPDGYDALIQVNLKGGSLKIENKCYVIEGAEEVILRSGVQPYKISNEQTLSELKVRFNTVATDYQQLLARQKATHGEIYNRVSIDLNTTDEEAEQTSEVLVTNIWNENTSPGIIQREFEAARYNILCASGVINPPNLQGIWSGTWTPPWCSDFTHDGNVQVAISNNLIGNMPELMMGYFNHHERNIENYRTNAKQFYGIEGIHIPSHTSSHGLNNHYDETWCMEYWNGGAAWAAFYFYDYYLYTQDKIFLKDRAFPFMTEALLFWENFLTLGEDGKYISVPSYSPENNPKEHEWQNCINATMDVAMVKELTQNWISAAEQLGVSTKEIKKKKAFYAKLPDYQIAPDGVLREWLWDGLTDNQQHRHCSHLYGVYEVPDPEILNSPALQEAVKKTINERMEIRKENGGGEMSFGMCHLAFAAVNMHDRATAEIILEYLSRYYWTRGMATMHNPGSLFNMDISGGIPSLVSRMIVNSRPGYITLFPALPLSWASGELKGVCARGNVQIDQVKWSAKEVKIQLSSPETQELIVDLGEIANWSNLQVSGAKYQLNGHLLVLKLKGNIVTTVALNDKF